MSVRDGAVAAIALSALAIAAAYGSVLLPGQTPGWGPWVFVAGVNLLILAFMTLGAARSGRGVGILALPIALTGVILGIAFAALLVMPPADPADPALFLGLPPRAAVVLYGIGLLPVLVLPLAYALTFDELTLSEDDVARVRAAGDEFRRAAAPGNQT